MADGFRIPFQEAESEFVEKRSRFISRVWRVETEEEAQARIQETKKKYYDARHNCWCYLLGPNLVRYSDDGEPQGTAGQPMLNVFQRENVTGAVCVVTRYFGGILLGAGGLTRAYSKGAPALGRKYCRVHESETAPCCSRKSPYALLCPALQVLSAFRHRHVYPSFSCMFLPFLNHVFVQCSCICFTFERTGPDLLLQRFHRIF